MPRDIVFSKEEVLNKAMHVFWKKGYNATSMEDLTQATKLNRSSIYNSFGNKLSLYEETLRYYQNQVGVKLQKVLLQSNGSKGALNRLFENLIDDCIADKEGKGCFNMNCKSEIAASTSSSFNGIKAWLEFTQEQTVSFFEQLVVQGQQDGVFKKDQDSRAYAHYLYSAYQGLRMSGILVKDRATLTAIADNTLKAIVI